MDYKYEFNRETCWYAGACDKHNTEECYAGCIRYMEMHFLMTQSRIPTARQYPFELQPEQADIESFKRLVHIKDNIQQFVKEGFSLYLYSDQFGNGKTSWAIKLMQRYFDEVWAGNGFRVRGLFVYVPTFLSKIKETISVPDPHFDTLRRLLPEVDVVIWDDIASGKLSDYDHNNLLTYIDQRHSGYLSNIYTGNLHGEELRESVGNRLYSRVFNDSTTIQLVGRDRRNGQW